jgi:hypothetical protein
MESECCTQKYASSINLEAHDQSDGSCTQTCVATLGLENPAVADTRKMLKAITKGEKS